MSDGRYENRKNKHHGIKEFFYGKWLFSRIGQNTQKLFFTEHDTLEIRVASTNGDAPGQSVYATSLKSVFNVGITLEEA